jgi:hypothetical protein
MPGEADQFLGIEIRHRENASKMEELPYVNTTSVNRPVKKNVRRKGTRKFRRIVPHFFRQLLKRFLSINR